jgi:Skp family chaperone for outer membrane proteins
MTDKAWDVMDLSEEIKIFPVCGEYLVRASDYQALEAERDEQVKWVKDLTDELIKAEAECNQMQNHRDRANLDLAKAKTDLEAAFKAKDLEYEELEAENAKLRDELATTRAEYGSGE